MTETPSIAAPTTQRRGFLARPSILIIDDDCQIQSLVKDLLAADHECTTVGSLDEATTVLRTDSFDLVLSDINLGESSGLCLVPIILEQAPETVVIMISGQNAIESAIEAMRVGAFDYITKPIDLSEIRAAVRRGLNQHKLLVETYQRQSHQKELAQQRTDEIEHLEFYDRLTDLPNQTLFMERCARAMATAGDAQNTVSVMLISLDRLDKINRTLGDSARSIILSQAAARLQTCVGRGDTVARFEGNKFALLLTSDEKMASAHTSLEISKVFRDRFRLGEQNVYLTPSIGVSVFPANGVDGIAILKNAAVALCHAEKTGGDNCQFYRTDMNAMFSARDIPP